MKETAIKMGQKDSKSRDLLTQALFYLLLLAGLIAAVFASYTAYQTHQKFIDPSNVYGTWIEVGAPPYDTDILSLSEQGVVMNHRLISTNFKFNGKTITINTGSGETVYAISGTFNSPQLKRLVPEIPTQQFVKEGYEHTAIPLNSSAVQQRRASLAEQFSK
ncbi:hypothetical protein MTsN2n6_07550 [Vibrio fortis]|jgi:hypothetical protein|tara:strand:+ start:1097 stop:1582 length:486 start_codon:yes stop_codon:yes gene_type:complete